MRRVWVIPVLLIMILPDFADIAEHYLGHPFQYPELARLSRIRNPDLIYPGDTIRINRKAGTEETSPLH